MTAWLAFLPASLGRAVLKLIWALQSLERRRLARFERRTARGLALLREWLSPQQREQFDCYNYFEVIGCDSGKSYRIQHGVNTNVVELDGDGRPCRGWCFVPEDNLVPGDVMLAQKIALETDEHGALAVAKPFKPSQLSLTVAML